jgi:hypothetical protein
MEVYIVAKTPSCFVDGFWKIAFNTTGLPESRTLTFNLASMHSLRIVLNFENYTNFCDGFSLNLFYYEMVSSYRVTDRHGRVINTPASYSGGPGFKSQPGDRLS